MRPTPALVALSIALLPRLAIAQAPPGPPTPREAFGFEPGEDFKLAPWSKYVAYFEALGVTSDRARVLKPGKTTGGRDFLAVLISSTSNLARLDAIRAGQRKLHDPRTLAPGEEETIVTSSPAVVVVTTTIHSTEVAGSLFAVRLAHALATATDAETKEILDGVLLVLVPSLNPDGIDIVHDWYAQTLGTPFEGSSPPHLYHLYVGHDNNRDWFMLTQKETRLHTRLLYREFLPEIVWDVHQMGRGGARLFVPPFADPVNPNLDPALTMEMNLVGTKMALDLTARGFTGIVQGVLYDNWWHGGNRNVPYRHNMVGILSEAASANLASPVFQRVSELRGHGHDLPEYKAQTNFPAPWPGGWWRVGDIVRYEEAAARSLLGLAARERALFKRNLVSKARRAIEKGKNEPPFAFLLPPEQDDPGSLRTLLDALLETGIEVERARAPFRADGMEYPAGTFVVPLAQPYRAHVKDLLERQDYPDILETTRGEPIRPYDIAGWTLPLQMGVRCVTVASPFEAEFERVTEIPRPHAAWSGSGEAAFVLDGRENRAAISALALLREGASVWRLADRRPGDFLVTGAGAASRVRTFAEEHGLRVTALAEVPSGVAAWRLSVPRVALYQPFTANMDEGWTRWVFDHFGWPYASIGNAAICAGALRERFDAIVLPSASRDSLVEGRPASEVPPAYAGGLGPEGVRRLREFVAEGGTLVCLDRSSGLPLRDFGLRSDDILDPKGEKKPPEKFNCPGSILETTADPTHPLAYGLPERLAVYFDDSSVFSIDEKEGKAVAKYPDHDPLLSGWLRGGEHLAGKAALAEIPYGKGRLVLIGFRCQFRGQSHGTFKVLWNAFFLSAAERARLP